MCLDATASKPLESETALRNSSTWAHRLRYNSPSATSDSAVSSSRGKHEKSTVVKTSFQNADSTAKNEESSFMPGNDTGNYI